MINFNWEEVHFENDLKNPIEERFKDDLQTLLLEKAKDSTVIFQEYFPAIKLQGIIINKNQTKLFSFICKITNNYTTTYTDTKTNKIIKKTTHKKAI